MHDNQRYQLANYNEVVDIWEYENFSETNWKDDCWPMRILPRIAHAPFVQMVKEILCLCRLFGSAPSFFFSCSSSSSSRNNQRFHFVCFRENLCKTMGINMGLFDVGSPSVGSYATHNIRAWFWNFDKNMRRYSRDCVFFFFF